MKIGLPRIAAIKVTLRNVSVFGAGAAFIVDDTGAALMQESAVGGG